MPEVGTGEGASMLTPPATAESSPGTGAETSAGLPDTAHQQALEQQAQQQAQQFQQMLAGMAAEGQTPEKKAKKIRGRDRVEHPPKERKPGFFQKISFKIQEGFRKIGEKLRTFGEKIKIRPPKQISQPTTA